MIDTDKYEGHTEGPWLELEVDKVVAYQFDENDNPKMICDVFRNGDRGSYYEGEWGDNETEANQKLIADAPILLEFIQKIVKDWCKPNQCNQAFGKDVRQLMYEYGLIIFDEETRRYEVKE